MNPLMQPRWSSRSVLRRAAITSVLAATAVVGVSACGNDNGAPGAGGGGGSGSTTYVSKNGSQVVINGSTLTYKQFTCDTPGHGGYSEARTVVGSLNSTKNIVTWTKAGSKLAFYYPVDDSDDILITDTQVITNYGDQDKQQDTYNRATESDIQAAQDRGLKSLGCQASASPSSSTSSALNADGTFIGDNADLITIQGSTLTYQSFACDRVGHAGYPDRYTAVGQISPDQTQVTWTKNASESNKAQFGGPGIKSGRLSLDKSTISLGGGTSAWGERTDVTAEFRRVTQAQISGFQDYSFANYLGSCRVIPSAPSTSN